MPNPPPPPAPIVTPVAVVPGIGRHGTVPGGFMMRRRQRKFLGVVATLAFVVTYALVAMALAQARFVQNAADPLRWLAYAMLGLAWVLPMLPLVRWMERPDEG